MQQNDFPTTSAPRAPTSWGWIAFHTCWVALSLALSAVEAFGTYWAFLGSACDPCRSGPALARSVVPWSCMALVWLASGVAPRLVTRSSGWKTFLAVAVGPVVYFIGAVFTAWLVMHELNATHAHSL